MPCSLLSSVCEANTFGCKAQVTYSTYRPFSGMTETFLSCLVCTGK